MGFTPAALRDLEKLDLNVRRKVFSDIEKLKETPHPSGAKKLTTKENLYRIRVGPGARYRAVYQIQDEKLIVLVVKVGHRKDVYRGLK